MRKRLLLGVGLVLLGGFAWVATPALSLRPYMPGGVDFERGIPKAKRISAKVVTAARAAHPHEQAPRWISRPVEAPHSFDLVGVAREMRAVQIRVRDDGGSWSNWVDQEDGTPIWIEE